MLHTGNITFDLVDRVRKNLCPDASFQASLIACIKRASAPAVYIEGEMALKKAEKADRDSGQQYFFDEVAPQEKFRAVVAVANAAAANKSFRIHPNMAIPEGSVLHELYHSNDETAQNQMSGHENLNIWVHSDGRPLGNQPITVEGRVFDDKIIAVVQPS